MPRDLFTDRIGRPKWNRREETSFRHELQRTAELPAHEAGEALLAVERQHGGRRGCVWAQLGQAPLTAALQHLAELAEVTRQSLAAGQAGDMALAYQAGAWRADAAVVAALAAVKKAEDVKVHQSAFADP